MSYRSFPATPDVAAIKSAIESAISTIIRDELPKAVTKAVKDTQSRPEYLNTVEASAYTGISTFQFEQWRTRGEGPSYVKLSKLVKYPRKALDDYLMARLCDHTGQNR